MQPSCDDCEYCNMMSFDTGAMQVCRLAARDVRLERDQLIEQYRSKGKTVPKCGPKGLNFVARVAA